MNDSQVLLDRATLLLNQGRPNDAIRELKNVLELDPNHDEALALLARCHYEKKNYPTGMEILRNAIQLNPANSYYIYLLAFGYYRQDDNTQAMTYLNRAITMDPYVPEYFGLLAFVFIEEKAFEMGLEKANEGLELDPENLTCLNARSTALNKLRRTNDAIETMQNALSQDPDNEFTHATVGWNYLEKGKNREAATHFREALRLDPDYDNARSGLKEALKSRIPPYKWLLQYSFWIHNKGKNAGWIIPIGIYIVIRISASTLSADPSTKNIGTIIIGAYLLFVVTSWIINPVANFLLLFNRDGKYALTATEKWSAITVVSSILLGFVCLFASMSLGEGGIYSPLMIAAIGCWLMAVPLGDIIYPVSFRHPGLSNKFALVLVCLGWLAIILSFIDITAAMVPGILFAAGFILNNWLGLFR